MRGGGGGGGRGGEGEGGGKLRPLCLINTLIRSSCLEVVTIQRCRGVPFLQSFLSRPVYVYIYTYMYIYIYNIDICEALLRGGGVGSLKTAQHGGSLTFATANAHTRDPLRGGGQCPITEDVPSFLLEVTGPIMKYRPIIRVHKHPCNLPMNVRGNTDRCVCIVFTYVHRQS